MLCNFKAEIISHSRLSRIRSKLLKTILCKYLLKTKTSSAKRDIPDLDYVSLLRKRCRLHYISIDGCEKIKKNRWQFLMLYASVCSTDNFPRNKKVCLSLNAAEKTFYEKRQASFFRGVQNVLEMSQQKFELWSFYENWNLCSLMALQRSTRTFFGVEGRFGIGTKALYDPTCSSCFLII